MWKLFLVIITPKADRFYCRIFLNAAANFFETKCEEEFGNILTFIDKRYKIDLLGIAWILINFTDSNV